MVDNYYIADQFSLLSKLMDIHGENSFKSKSYSIAAFNIEKLPVQLNTLQPSEIFSLKGMGESTGKKVMEILSSGKLEVLDKLVSSTPPGVLEMLNIKGLGPKKINTIWKEMQLESLGELLYACQENRLLLYKGFGAKTQQNVMEAIEFYLSNRQSYLFAEARGTTDTVVETLKSRFPGFKLEYTGEYARHMEVINSIDLVTTIPAGSLDPVLASFELDRVDTAEPWFTYKKDHGLPLRFLVTEQEDFHRHLFETCCSPEFLLEWKNRYGITTESSQEEYFSRNNLHYLPPFLREDPRSLDDDAPVAVIVPSDIRGIIHSHSTWSDGSNTIEEMAAACIRQGFEYLVISDHSKSAFYANGLNEERIIAQHQQINELNLKLHPFRIFKSIECDILHDGSMDFPDDVLASFDLVIASVHSNLKMTEEKAMARLIRAIEHPATTILGHMTGRLLLSRPGYPVDHRRIIDACKANNVVIELNAHPRRLDMDWRYIREALDKGVMISIDPDAHAIEGFADVEYGVLAAQKAGLPPDMNLSSQNLNNFIKLISKS